MDVREKLVELIGQVQDCGCDVTDVVEMNYVENITLADHLIAHGVTVQEWISVKDRTPTEADGTVWVCLADVFPYNEKEPYIDAKHDRRITEAFYSQFSKRWYKEGAVFPDGIVTHWMEKPQPPKGE
jgi:hypothetical protein